MTSSNTERIRAYYEQNTQLFTRFGSAARARSIHRALWTPTARTLDDALQTAHRLIAAELRTGDQTVLDLGCGVGGALAYLGTHGPAGLRLLGVNLSPTQAIQARRAEPRAQIVEASFLQLPFATCVDFTFSIEAFAHAPSAAAYFAEAARVLRPGGRLCVIDDTLNRAAPDTAGRVFVDAFRAGWHVPSFQTRDVICQAADSASLTLLRDVDLTAHLRLRALPERAALALLRTARGWMHNPVVSASLGSVALQQLYARGDAAYRLMVFG